MTQAGVAPPTFVFFTTDPASIHFSYRRYLENRLREAYGFDGTPIRLVFREQVREKRERKRRAKSRWAGPLLARGGRSHPIRTRSVLMCNSPIRKGSAARTLSRWVATRPMAGPVHMRRARQTIGPS